MCVLVQFCVSQSAVEAYCVFRFPTRTRLNIPTAFQRLPIDVMYGSLVAVCRSNCLSTSGKRISDALPPCVYEELFSNALKRRSVTNSAAIIKRSSIDSY